MIRTARPGKRAHKAIELIRAGADPEQAFAQAGFKQPKRECRRYYAQIKGAQGHAARTSPREVLRRNAARLSDPSVALAACRSLLSQAPSTTESRTVMLSYRVAGPGETPQYATLEDAIEAAKFQPVPEDSDLVLARECLNRLMLEAEPRIATQAASCLLAHENGASGAIGDVDVMVIPDNGRGGEDDVVVLVGSE